MTLRKKIKKLLTTVKDELFSKKNSKKPLNQKEIEKKRHSHHPKKEKHVHRQQRQAHHKQQSKHQSHKDKPFRHTKSQDTQVSSPQYKGKAFSDFGFHPTVLEKLKENNFAFSTEVQEKSIGVSMSGKNVFCSSETGSGKTLSFLLPMIHKFYKKELDQALIICPTREIAIQIQKTLKSLTDDSITSALVIGGTDMGMQKQALLQYPKILVATPGRLLDMLNTGLIWLNYTGYVVLDEADRMLDMGFEEDLIKIHEQLSGAHQTLLFSATLFPEIKKMAKRYASDYEEIIIGNPTSVAGSVEHVLVEMNDHEKLTALAYLLRKHRGKAMVFFNSINETSRVLKQLHRQKLYKLDCIHSKVVQSAREAVVASFRAGSIYALLCSDIAARGIDIPNVDLVINYDIPNNSEEYIHRVGRTGRAGKSGKAISFYSHKDKKKLVAVEKLIESKIKRKRDYRGLI
ncbi:hypothetical protein DID78_01310 [Candidatus Marinamargulisbacteria bacterium SCGC AG-343-D04]|nr:hypothetical protein DID78_01310 [Candidatus Marinamargulisbacteria bacterium SCGC AG-343-D04]